MSTSGITFSDFTSGPGGRICRSLGLSPTSWNDLVSVAARDRDLVDRARQRAGTASSGELAVLVAVLCACDFSWLADELGGGETWRRIERLDLDYRLAVAAVVARVS